MMKYIAIAIISLLGLLFIAALTTVSIFISGFVVSNLWGWLIVPIFHLAELSLMQAAALSLFVHFFTVKPTMPGKTDDVKTELKKAGFAWFAMAVTLILGWAIHFFI